MKCINFCKKEMLPDDLPLGTVVKLRNRQFMNLFLHLNLDLEQYNYRKENIFVR